MRNAERSRGVILSVLDVSALEAEALAFRQKTHPDCYEARIYGGNIAVANSKETGHLYTICTEGVGPDGGVSNDDPLFIEFHGSYYVREESTLEDLLGRPVPGEIKPGSHTFDCMPFASTTLTSDEIRVLPILEEVDLADFIRSFGARLENNFWAWFKVLS